MQYFTTTQINRKREQERNASNIVPVALQGKSEEGRYIQDGTAPIRQTSNVDVLPVLTTYPTTSPDKIGQRFIYKGNEWHYMTLAELQSMEWDDLVSPGFPAPVAKAQNWMIMYPDATFQDLSSSYAPVPVNPYVGEFDYLGHGNPAIIRNFLTYTNLGEITVIRNAVLLKSLEDNGTREAIDFRGNDLTVEQIDKFFTELPSTSKTATLNVSNNPGAATCDATIATSKGYTVIT